MVWIDHVTVRTNNLIPFFDHLLICYVQTARIGRQHIVLGTEASKRVTISNSYIDGVTSYSATCDGYHYWGIYLDGSNDYVTLKGNYIYHTSGRSPKVQGDTLLHAVSLPPPHTTSPYIIEAHSGLILLIGQQLLVRQQRPRL